MRTTRTLLVGLVGLVGTVAACSSEPDEIVFGPEATEATEVTASTSAATSGAASTAPVVEGDVTVTFDVSAAGEPISPLILGVSSTLTAEEFRDAGLTLNSWGGNPATRYNYEIGHAWNNASDWEFRNTDFGGGDFDGSRDFLSVSAEAGIESRVAVPTLGWVARDDLTSTCSFPDGDGSCLAAAAVGNCADPKETADPTTANVESTPEGVAAWIEGLIEDGFDIRFIAMDNEPELWGYTHYDVHPACPTYEEILDKYLTYARAVREVAPDAELLGPVACCWFDYWNIAPGPEDGGEHDFLTWFLQQVKAHDEVYGQRTLDVLDVHYYPQSDVFNDNTDTETNARRLRSTRSLWDPAYGDESWISQPIMFIPRLQDMVEQAYPDTPLFISEWNFGADETMNGAVAIADVLGIYGSEGVYAAAYWRNPDVGSPGYMAFKMHGNYDGAGSRFGGRVVPAQSTDTRLVAGYGALDEGTGTLRVMLLNKSPDDTVEVGLTFTGFEPAETARRFTYGADDPSTIVPSSAAVSGPVALPPTSITVLELDPAA